MIYGVQTQEAIIRGGGAGGLIGAVHFAGSIQGHGPTHLVNNSLSAGTDNGLFCFSAWMTDICATANNANTFMVSWPTTNYQPWFGTTATLTGGSGNHFTASVQNNNAQYLWNPFSTSWHHFLFSLDSNQASGSKIFSLYVDDVLQTASSHQDRVAAIVPSINGKPFWWGDDSFNDGPDFNCAYVWISPNHSLHLSDGTIPTATRRQFINADLTPVDPSTLPSSAILFAGGASSFATNRGTGGAFTLAGTLTDASSHP